MEWTYLRDIHKPDLAALPVNDDEVLEIWYKTVPKEATRDRVGSEGQETRVEENIIDWT